MYFFMVGQPDGQHVQQQQQQQQQQPVQDRGYTASGNQQHLGKRNILSSGKNHLGNGRPAKKCE